MVLGVEDRNRGLQGGPKVGMGARARARACWSAPAKPHGAVHASPRRLQLRRSAAWTPRPVAERARRRGRYVCAAAKQEYIILDVLYVCTWMSGSQFQRAWRVGSCRWPSSQLSSSGRSEARTSWHGKAADSNIRRRRGLFPTSSVVFRLAFELGHRLLRLVFCKAVVDLRSSCGLRNSCRARKRFHIAQCRRRRTAWRSEGSNVATHGGRRALPGATLRAGPTFAPRACPCDGRQTHGARSKF